MFARRLCQRSSRYTTTKAFTSWPAAEDMAQVDYCVVGGGVVGLAVGRQLASRGSTLVVEKNTQEGMETSSRNSEVIHGGLYYPQDSLRTKLCIEGKHMLYEYCQRNNIAYSQVGKLVVAQTPREAERLHQLQQHCQEVGVDTELVTRDRVIRDEPMVRAEHGALWSPTTGIVDSHGLLTALIHDMEEAGGDFARSTQVVDVRQDNLGFYRLLMDTGDPGTPLMTVRAAAVVNAAGLWADRIANMLQPNKYRLHFAKGRYYALTSGGKIKVSRLIYPVPAPELASLGTHLTLDLGGAVRFGPDLEWIDSNSDYAIDASGLPNESVVRAINQYLPAVKAEHLRLDYAGIRPKLQPPGGGFHDFVVRQDMPEFVNLVGIESPGLTASLAIAQMVDKLLHH